MDLIHALLRRIRPLVRRRDAERDLDAELRFHLEMESEKYVREEGLSPGAVRRRA